MKEELPFIEVEMTTMKVVDGSHHEGGEGPSTNPKNLGGDFLEIRDNISL